jgi:hypothetical protein
MCRKATYCKKLRKLRPVLLVGELRFSRIFKKVTIALNVIPSQFSKTLPTAINTFLLFLA